MHSSLSTDTQPNSLRLCAELDWSLAKHADTLYRDDVQIDGCDRADEVSGSDLPLALKLQIDSIAMPRSAEIDAQLFFERRWKQR